MSIKFVFVLFSLQYTAYILGYSVNSQNYQSREYPPKNVEIVDSCFLYLGHPGDLNVLLDQLVEMFQDLDVQDVKEWFKKEITMTGYILKVPVLKGHEHRYGALMERFPLPKNTVTTEMPNIPFEDDNVDSLTSSDFSESINEVSEETVLPSSETGYVDNHVENQSSQEEQVNSLDNSQIEKKLTSPSTPYVSGAADLLYTDFPSKGDDIGQDDFLNEDVLTEDGAIRYQNSDNQNRKYAISEEVERESDVTNSKGNLEVVPSESFTSSIEERFLNIEKPLKNSFLPEWFLNDKTNHDPRYSVADLYKKFPQLAVSMGYTNNRNCVNQGLSLEDFQIDPLYFKDSLNALDLK